MAVLPLLLTASSMNSSSLRRTSIIWMEGSLNGKKIALFGSYGWGDGQWMRDWVERAQGDGAQVLNGEGLICNCLLYTSAPNRAQRAAATLRRNR